MLDYYPILKFEKLDLSSKQQAVGLVTPEFAQKALEVNFENNRPVSFNRVRELVREIKKGNWIESDSIKFAENGFLIDGQHRLNAIVQSGTAVPCRIDTGLPFTAATVLDMGMRRTTVHIAQILGKPYNSKDCAVFRSMCLYQRGRTYGGYGSLQVSSRELVENMSEYEDAIFFVTRNCGASKPILYAPVLCVVACAYYSENHGRLRDFLRVWHTGISDGLSDSGAVVLRDLYFRQVSGSSGAGQRSDFIDKTQSALSNFLARKEVRSIKGTSKLLWKVPGLYKEPSK